MTDTPDTTYHYHVIRRALDVIDAAPAPGASLTTSPPPSA